jgi:hypothetical protein
MIIKPLRELKNFPLSGNKKAFDAITKAYKQPSPLKILLLMEMLPQDFSLK